MWTAERAEYINIQRGKNWNLVPSVGLVFGLPSINLNTGQIAAYKARQSEVAAKLKSMDMRYQVLLNEALMGLRVEIEKVENEGYKLSAYSSELETRGQINRIHLEAYRKREMRPLEYYKEKLLYDQVQKEYQLAVRAYNIMVLNIEKLAHYNSPNEQIFYVEYEGQEGSGQNPMNIEPRKLPASVFGEQKEAGQEPGTKVNPLGN